MPVGRDEFDGHRTTTLRSTSPRSILWNASSTSSSAIVSDTNRSRSSRPCRYSEIEQREVAAGQAVAVPARLERAAPTEELDHRDVGNRHRRASARRPARRCRRGRGRRTPARAPSGCRPPRCTRRRRSRRWRPARPRPRRPADAFTVWVAPNSLAHSSLRSSRSTATIVVAPASLAPAMAASPTPPQPNTATVSPRCTLPVSIAAPMPAITPQPSRPAVAAGAAGSTLVHWPAATSVFSANAPMPSAGDSSVPSVSVIFCVALYVAKQYCGLPLRQLRQLPHTARQLRTTKSPGFTLVTPAPTDSTMPAASWPSRNGKSSLMPPSR